MTGFILASASTRRLALLRSLGFEPPVRVACVDELRRPDEPPMEYVRRLAREKAAHVAARWAPPDPPWVLGADTIVISPGGAVLEKPADAEDAARMLRLLSGAWHRVLTAFCLRHVERHGPACDRVVEAEVEVRPLTGSEIAGYVASTEPLDKAGAYGIQGLGAFMVRQVRGSWPAVVGLPVCEVVEALLELGVIPHFP